MSDKRFIKSGDFVDRSRRVSVFVCNFCVVCQLLHLAAARCVLCVACLLLCRGYMRNKIISKLFQPSSMSRLKSFCLKLFP